MEYQVGARSHPGKVRDNNEDAYYTTPSEGVLLVADGMGGHKAGEVASAITRDIISDMMVKSLAQPAAQIEDAIRSAFIAAHDKVRAEAEKVDERKGMGCTCVFVLLRDQKFYCAHVGDSRVFLHRKGELQQITRDHSYVEELFIRGLIKEEEKATHPYKHQITRYIGSKQKLEVDIVSGPVWNGDMFLLCSDGLTDEVEPPQIAQLLTTHADDVEKGAESLLQAALDKGAHDNTTVVLARVTSKKTSFFKKLLGW